MSKLFWAMLSFITRLPVPRRWSQGLDFEHYSRGIITFPLIGLLLGAISGLVFMVLQAWCGVPLAALFSVLVLALMTGLVGGLRPTQILQALYHGCGRLVWMFILYWLYNPILELMDGLHAYQGLLDYTQPLLEGISPAWLCFSIFAFNIIGHVPGAAVAQMTFTHKIFGPMLMAAGVPPQGTTAVLLASSQVDWFGPLTVLTSASVTNKSLVSSEKAAAVNPFWGRLF
mgnify:CR=1 FL=1